MKLPYIFLVIAILFNVAANLTIKGLAAKESHTFLQMLTNIPLYAAACLFGINFIFYTKALNTLSISIAYPIVVGFSIVLIVIFSLIFFNEELHIVQISGIGLIIVGIILLFYNIH